MTLLSAIFMNKYVSAPISSITSTVPSIITAFTSFKTFASSYKSSGRIPMIISLPIYSFSCGLFIIFEGKITLTSAKFNVITSMFCFTRTLKKFICGLPKKPATNKLQGCAYSFCGVSTCCTMPSFITTIRVPIVIASRWSWVT